MLEQLLAYACLLGAGLMTIENYNNNLDVLFMANPDDDLLLDLEFSSSDLNKTISLIKEKCYGQTIDYDSFGCCLLSHLKTIYSSDVDTLENFGKKAYALWGTLPADIQLTEPFHTMSYADDCLSWGDSQQTKDLYEKMFCYYDSKRFSLECAEKMRHYDPETNMLAGLYDLLVAVVDGFPDKDFSTYTKKQKKCLINNLINFKEENAGMLSPGMNELIYPYPELSYKKLCDTLKTADKKHMESMKARRDEWIAFSKRFDKLTEEALARFIDDYIVYHEMFLVKGQTGEASFSPAHSNAYRQTLRLENPVFSENFNPEIYETSDAEIDIINNGYRLSFVQAGEIITVDFSNLCLETQLINYSVSNRWDGSPWCQISESLTALGYKKDILGREFLNKKEKSLWRLGEFSPIHSIDSSYQSISGDKKADKMFIDFAVRVGNNRVAELAQQYSDAHLKKKEKIRKALIKELKKPSSEALARLILSEIKDAAVQYPTEIELDIAPKVLTDTRKTVTNIMKQKGYEGEYPHFKKMSSLKGIKLLEIQGQPAFVCNEKHMACMIDCFEHSINFETLGMSYTASTIFLKKDELYTFDTLDGYSGFFPYKHRRRARTISPNLDFREDGGMEYDLESSTIAAAKTAECEKLTKEERKSIASVGPGLYGCLFYGGMFLFMGLLFGLLMCPGLFLVCLVIGTPFTIFSSDAPSFIEFVKFLIFELPWLWLFIFCVVGFGLPMTILTAISKKRG